MAKKSKPKKSKTSIATKPASFKVLIPLVSLEENNIEFIEKATKNATEVILLFVVDTASMIGHFGYEATNLSKANVVIADLKDYLGPKGLTVKDIIDWGDTLRKIQNISLLQNADKIAVKKQDNEWFKALVAELKKGKIKVEIY